METNRATDTKIIALPENEQKAWLKDLATHKKLRDASQQYSAARTEVLEGLERLKTVDDPTKEADHGLRPLSAAIRLRMALRVAVAKVRNRKTPAPKSVLNDELAYLNARLSDLAGQMHALETRILSAEPGTLDEARLLLDFISDRVAAGRRISSDQLAPLIKRCAVVMTSPDAGPRAANSVQLRQRR